MTTPRFLTDAPRFLFFTGKGGVGKTSIACASAVALARRGLRVLLVSTDPASNLGHVFGMTIGASITGIPAVTGLSALEIDPQQTAAAYRERIIAPVRNLLPVKEIEKITEQLSGSCTTEIASFNEFTALLTTTGGPAEAFDHIVFDTAPTGHTIRLLQLPAAWTEFLEGTGDASCLGPLSGLDAQRDIYRAAVRAITDPTLTRLVLVARAQTASLNEIARTYAELADIGVRSQHVVLNAVLPEPTIDDPIASAIHRREQTAVAALPTELVDLPTDRIELKATNMVGIDALDQLFADTSAPSDAPEVPAPDIPAEASLGVLIDELAESDHGLIMCMGKGGVGKTTIAAAIATELARRGHDVHLTTTDPAAHLEHVLAGSPEGLRVSRIDPAEATDRYRTHILTTKGAHLDEQGRAALAEDLRSPCTEEVAVFQAFSRIIGESRRRFVVVDTAPTGHTLLLLDATGSYHREIARQMGEGARFTTPLMRLRDPAATRIIVVTLAETTPVLEAVALQADLERAGIHPWAWVVNNSLAAAAPSATLLRYRAAEELAPIRTIAQQAQRYAVVPMSASEPLGATRLSALATDRASLGLTQR
ncbi:arsenical pump-driving ATPase [Nocardia abscessus]|uniref:arsenical pump-driving ATPase n=1 Tax=Nocardia abscessus TaxID=120957 RepID=UPI0002E6F83B|nr:arsenical pump-driving ATPase [Nocardia abscessus]MCC3331645.1 arsenical pump-driving ATPase [Nocardia abscessus]